MDYFQERIENDQESVKRIVNDAIHSFNEKEKYLIENDLSERCICARFAMHLTDALRNSDFSDYIVDVEYNRGARGKEKGIKKMDGHPITVDLIVHKRGYDPRTGFQNLICMEMKKSTNPHGCDDDIVRLKKMCSFEYRFRYMIGFMLLINMKSNSMEIKETIIRSVNGI